MHNSHKTEQMCTVPVATTCQVEMEPKKEEQKSRTEMVELSAKTIYQIDYLLS